MAILVLMTSAETPSEISATPETPPEEKLSFNDRARRYLKSLAFRILVYLAIYFVVSVVSIGPCFWYWFEATYVNGPRWIARFYAPLLWLCDHIEPLGRWVNLYIRWWIL